MKEAIEKMKTSPWLGIGEGFLLDWLREIVKESRKKASNQHRGSPQRRVKQSWHKRGYDDNDIAHASRVANKLMECVLKKHPEVGRYL